MRALASMIVLGLLAVPHGDGMAQTRGLRVVHKHQGFWLSAGAGGGWEDFDGSFGNLGRGGAFYLRMGGTPNPQVLFGGEVLGWFDGSDPDNLERWNVTGTVLAYPSRAGGWFLKTGVGFAEHNVFGAERSGLGATFGTGFDVRLGRNFYVTPNVDYLVQFFDNSTVGTLLITFGVTWH